LRASTGDLFIVLLTFLLIFLLVYLLIKASGIDDE
jgi:hypothetical protein